MSIAQELLSANPIVRHTLREFTTLMCKSATLSVDGSTNWFISVDCKDTDFTHRYRFVDGSALSFNERYETVKLG